MKYIYAIFSVLIFTAIITPLVIIALVSWYALYFIWNLRFPKSGRFQLDAKDVFDYKDYFKALTDIFKNAIDYCPKYLKQSNAE